MCTKCVKNKATQAKLSLFYDNLLHFFDILPLFQRSFFAFRILLISLLRRPLFSCAFFCTFLRFIAFLIYTHTHTHAGRERTERRVQRGSIFRKLRGRVSAEEESFSCVTSRPHENYKCAHIKYEELTTNKLATPKSTSPHVDMCATAGLDDCLVSQLADRQRKKPSDSICRCRS